MPSTGPLVDQVLRTGKPVSAEELVVEGPDGQSAAVLFNATPVRAGDGEVESVVATVQDTGPLAELERLRSEFLGMVGHELRMGGVLSDCDAPVIFLSAYDRSELIADAFEMGAADYIVKPFAATELAARVKAALRRRPQDTDTFVLGDLVVNYADRSAAVSGRVVELGDDTKNPKYINTVPRTGYRMPKP